MTDSDIHVAYNEYREILLRQGKTTGWIDDAFGFSVFKAGWDAKAYSIVKAERARALREIVNT